MQLQELFLAWICNNLLNPLVLLLLLNKLPNEINKPLSLTLMWMCDAQCLCGLDFSSWAGLHIQAFFCVLWGCFSCTDILSLFIGCFILESHSLCENLAAHLELGACARCWAKGISCSLGTCSQVPAASNNPQRLQSVTQSPASQSLTAGNDKEISWMTIPSY